MEEIRDMEGRLVCYGDAFTGKLEIAYKKQQIFMLLPVGGQIVITREGVMTTIVRRTSSQFYVYSQRAVGA